MTRTTIQQQEDTSMKLDMTRRAMLMGSAATLGLLGSSAFAFERTEKGKILVFAGRQPVPLLDPSVKYDWSTRMMQQSIYDALVKYVGDPPQIEPWLAESWESNEDATVWTFRLVEGATFHNGDPLDAEAVKFSFTRTLALGQGPAWMLNQFLDADGIETLDARTVRFNLSEPFAPFLSFLPWWYIMNPNEVMANEQDGDYGQAWLIDHAAGSGPYKIKRWEQETLYELERNEDYWKGWSQEEPLAGIIYQLIRESASQRAALQAGEADIVEGLSSDDFDVVGNMPGIVVENHPGMTTFGIKMNNQRGPTADVNFRKAIAHAMDYDALLQIYNGNAVLQTSPFPFATQGHIDVEMPRLDLDKAREYLAQTDHPDGGLSLKYVYVEGLEETRQMGLVLLDNLQQLNIDIEMAPSTWPNMLAMGGDIETSPDLMAIFATPVSTDPDAVSYFYHRNSWGQYYGTAYYDNDEVHALIDRARTIADWEERRPIYEQIQRMIVEDQPEIFGMLANRRWAMRDYVGGFQFCPVRFTGEVDLYPLTIA
jgi:peptide/nickel transport system substrate-binding protein